jgi:hypothetical protein
MSPHESESGIQIASFLQSLTAPPGGNLGRGGYCGVRPEADLRCLKDGPARLLPPYP